MQLQLTSHSLYLPDNHMRLSNNILEQLNIISSTSKSVLNILERTQSAIGKRALRERILRPITSSDELETSWTEIEYATKCPVPVIQKDLKALYDIPRLHFKIAEVAVEPIDILQLFQSYSATSCLIKNLRSTPLACPAFLEESITEFRRKFSTLFDEEKAGRRDSGESIGFLTAISGPKTFAIEERIGEIQETWDDTWTSFCKSVGIPIDSFHLVKQSDYEWTWEGSRTFKNVFSRQGLTNVQLDIKKSGPISVNCTEFKAFTDNLYSVSKDLNKVLKEELKSVCDDLWECVRGFQTEWISWLGRVDCSLALASAAKEFGWIRPTIGDSLSIEGLRHPLIENTQTRAEYVKHNVQFDSVKGWLIYGVNASGKSSLMKATGISILLAQAGSFVPADSMSFRPYDAAFSRIWNQDNLWAGLSSFAVEIVELRDILQYATDKSIVLGDELCSGTESLSATALVASTIEHLESIGANFMFATHLHDLIKVPGLLRPGIAVWHLKVQNVNGKLIYDRTLQPGSGSNTYGLEVAKAMGIPSKLLERALTIRRELCGEVSLVDAPKSTWNSAIVRHSCEICNHRIVNDLEVHHIQQRSEGGSNALRNLIVVCKTCHDKHHAGILEIGPLQQTSDGLERKVLIKKNPVKSQKASKFTLEEQEDIRETIIKYQGRPSRIRLDLAERGIQISVAQINSFK